MGDRMIKWNFHPLTPGRWDDFEKLFGPRGAYAGCWCMLWRLARKDFERNQGEGNRKAMKALVDSGKIPGILAYAGKEPAGWCSIARREDFPVLERSRVLKRLDDKPVWSIVCFFIGKMHRGRGLGEELIRAAVRYAGKRGAKIVEAYPAADKGKTLPPFSVFMGVPKIFERAGFKECARPSASKLIYRYWIV